MTTTRNRAAIYTRQSKDTAGTGLAVARQLAEDEKLCAARGWQVVARLSDNDMSASSGKPRPGYKALMGMVEAGTVDVIVVWAVDRLVRRLADLEQVIETCEQHGVKLATVSGDLDLSTDQGRLVGRILASVARGEVERKSARQKLAAQHAAANGQRWTGCPRPFGYRDDHVTPDPAEAAAIRWAADALLGGSTISAVMREWNRRGLTSPQSGQPITRQSVATILRNPALAGLATYDGEQIGGRGKWQPVLAEETWRAVNGLLADPSRKPPRGVRTLLGGIAVCACGNVATGSQSQQRQPIYRCQPSTRNGRPGPHATIRAMPVDQYVTAVIIERLSRPDVADLVTPPTAGPDVPALRGEAAAIRRNLDELAADRALGLVSRAQMIAATERGNRRLADIGADLAASATVPVLAPFAAGQAAGAVWASLDLARHRAVITALTAVVLHPAGRGARIFDPDTVEIAWRDPGAVVGE